MRTETFAALLVAAVVAVPLVAAAVPGESAGESRATDVAPGEQLSGVVAVGDAELRGEVDDRTFGAALDRADSDAAKAEVVADRLADAEQRLEKLQQREQELRDAREAGDLTEGEFRAKMARLVAETEQLRRTANTSARVAESLPEDALREAGVNVDAIRTLQERAAELSGPEVAEIARSIAGPEVGDRVGPDCEDLPEAAAPPRCADDG